MKCYLTHIDILGFTEMVRDNSKDIDFIFNIIEQLNAHKHESFNTIVFSDTILIYNKFDCKSQKDHQYVVMYSIEFIQDLFYRLINSNVYFRAVIDYGDFIHQNKGNIQKFYGTSLLNCQILDKKIKSIGAFITDQANIHQNIFPTRNYKDDLNFIYFQQPIESFSDLGHPSCEYDFELIDEIGLAYNLCRDMIILKNIFDLANNHPCEDVKYKYKTYYNFIKDKYLFPVEIWERNGFDMNSIVASDNWNKICKEIRNINQEKSWK